MPLPELFLGLGGLLGLGKSIFGATQYFGANKPNLKEYEIPSEIDQIIQLARQQASQTRLPGQDIMEGQIASQGATAIQTAKEVGTGASALGAASNIFSNQLNALRGLSVEAAQRQQESLRNLQSALGLGAQAKDMAYQYNEYFPYMMNMREFYDKQQAGMTNMFGGIDDALGMGMSYSQYKMMKDLMDRLYPVPGGINNPVAGNQSLVSKPSVSHGPMWGW